MLERLTITGFALARSVVMEPGPGLNVFTGETGAGKSLVVDALAFVFGARRGREVIATGADHATVEAILRTSEGQITVERGITLNGRSSARIDGQTATLEQLQALAAEAVDIHGQSEQLAILKPAVQLRVLDEFAGLQAEREQLAGAVRELRETRRSLRALATDARERERLLAQLRFEVEEIEASAAEAGEDEDLRQEQLRLSSISRLNEETARALDALDAAPFGEAVRAVADLTARDPSAADVSALGSVLEAAGADLSRALRRYRETLEEDPERLQAVEERLDLLARLRRKYGDSIAEVIAYGRTAAERLERLTSSEASVEALTAREAALLEALGQRARTLSTHRRARAGDLVRAISAELAGLGMGGAALSVGFSCEDAADGVAVDLPDYEVVLTERDAGGEGLPIPRAFTESGIDRVEFLASFNPGETPRPLSTVASGGETSRFLLALTTVLGAAATPRLAVFDEVDEGVGGRAGGLVGEALARLAVRHQVLCVTHLPQVAAHGTRHFVVRKQSDGERTWSEVQTVEGEGRVDELAAMLGAISEATRATARELLADRS